MTTDKEFNIDRSATVFMCMWIVVYAVLVIVLVCMFVGLGANTAKADPPDHRAVFVLKDSPGGAVTEFMLLALTLEQKHVRVIIDGQCASSCTILFSDVYDLDICVTETARLRFHYPYIHKKNTDIIVYADNSRVSSLALGKAMWSMLPTKLQKLAPLSKWPSVYNGYSRNSTYDVPGALLVEKGIVHACS